MLTECDGQVRKVLGTLMQSLPERTDLRTDVFKMPCLTSKIFLAHSMDVPDIDLIWGQTHSRRSCTAHQLAPRKLSCQVQAGVGAWSGVARLLFGCGFPSLSLGVPS